MNISERKKELNVITVGGGVAGLSLANMLEKFGINYSLLEAHTDLAPQAGASIALLPTYLGSARALSHLRVSSINLIYVAQGEQFSLFCAIRKEVRHELRLRVPIHILTSHRLGYPQVFTERQQLLRILYDNLKDKSRCMTNKRIERVELCQDRVQVHTEDGSLYEGDVVLGADGTHSIVREQMLRVIPKSILKIPDTFSVSADVRCMFGISENVQALLRDSEDMITYPGRSYLIISGPSHRTYWFLFESLNETIRGTILPRYSEEDEIRMVERYANDHVGDSTTFRGVYQHRLRSALLPMEEFVSTRWSYDRIITIGDSAHKIDPISGQGGNNAIEDAATLVNSITRWLSSHHSREESIAIILSTVQTSRIDRMRQLAKEAHLLQSILTRKAFASQIVSKYLVPALGIDKILLRRINAICVEAPHINVLQYLRKHAQHRSMTSCHHGQKTTNDHERVVGIYSLGLCSSAAILSCFIIRHFLDISCLKQ
ncbi:unnamed protein product [Clonostachys rhizophaga]|uniref:FAD-binding domain-containing protein n=1 Tax=Clonostachys rhizophaga TaxID=160324 RepID=A0A9N9VHH0_9HYPO|nr:unnamed protein product [Clonostachys rhizophaga]